MSFPISHTGQLEITHLNHSADRVTTSIHSGLEKINAAKIVVNENNITFSGGILCSISNLHILSAVNYGEICVRNLNNKISIKYSLNFRGALTISIILIFGIFAPISYFNLNLDMPNEKLVWGISLICGWLCFFGGNYLVTIIRFPSFIHKMVKSY